MHRLNNFKCCLYGLHHSCSQQLGNLLSRCKKVAGAYSFYLFFEILWKTATGKFLRDQNIMVP